jgi:hypothetical protein
MQPVAVPGSRDGLDLTQTEYGPVPINGLPPALSEPVRPMPRTSVTQAFPDAVVGAALGLARFGLRLAMCWAAERAREWIAAFPGLSGSLVLCLSFLKLYTGMRAALAPPSICRYMRRSLRRSLELPYFNVNRCGLEGGWTGRYFGIRLESDLAQR